MKGEKLSCHGHNYPVSMILKIT